MNKTLLTLENLYDFYNQRKRSVTFDSDKTGYNLTVQTHGLFEVKDELSEGLLYGTIKAFHDLGNRNKSYIETDILKEKMFSIKDRPIMADITETEETDENGNPIKDFSGHTMRYDEKLDKMIYKELPVGHCVNPDSIRIEYDEEHDRNFVYSDVVIYEEYTDACDILRRRQTVDCSVELTIKQMHWNAIEKVLYLDDFYVQGITLLGKHVMPGMAGSKLSLKDFSQSNNSIFSDMSDVEYSQLINSLDKLNETLSRLNMNQNNTEDFKKGGNRKVNMNKFDELLAKYSKSVEDITFDCEGLSDEELEMKFAEMFEEKPAESKQATTSDGNAEDPKNPEGENNSTKENNSISKPEEGEPVEPENPEEKETFSKTFTLSHEDLRTSLYRLLAPLEETLNECYWIVKTFDNYFIYQSCCDNFYSQKFTVNDNVVTFDGERVEVFAEFVTADEKAELENMRANYSSISEKLEKYETAEMLADKKTVFSDKAYASYLDTDEFKALMSEENLKKFSKDELIEKADAALGRLVKTSKTFSYQEPEQTGKPMPATIAFGAHEPSNSFLDSLLKRKIK